MPWYENFVALVNKAIKYKFAGDVARMERAADKAQALWDKNVSPKPGYVARYL